MSNERLMLDLGKHVSTRVAEMMSQALNVVDNDEERMVLVLIALSRMMQAGAHMIGGAIEEWEEMPVAHRVMCISIILCNVLDGNLQMAVPDRLTGKRMENAMRLLVERTQNWALNIKEA